MCEIKKVDLENKLDFSLKNKPSNYMCINLTNNFTCKPVDNKLHSSESIDEMILNDHKAKCLVLKQSIYDLNKELNSESLNKRNKRNSLFKIGKLVMIVKSFNQNKLYLAKILGMEKNKFKLYYYSNQTM